jgi:3-methyladenine DNA glycosylase AlkD
MIDKVAEILHELEILANPIDREGMGRYGIDVEQAYGIRMPVLRKMAKPYRRQHELALALWQTGIHEARILATLVDDPKQVTEAQLEAWVADFSSWDLVDQFCSSLLRHTPYAYPKVFEWCERKEEYIKRAAYTEIAVLAIHDKKAPDEKMEQFFLLIVAAATDERNFVKKSVNWALRQIGKRNLALNAKAIEVAEQIAQIDSPSARWIANDALRELQSEKVQTRLIEKAEK